MRSVAAASLALIVGCGEVAADPCAPVVECAESYCELAAERCPYSEIRPT